MKFYLDSQIWITTSPFSARNDQIVPRQPFHDKAVGDGGEGEEGRFAFTEALDVNQHASH